MGGSFIPPGEEAWQEMSLIGSLSPPPHQPQGNTVELPEEENTPEKRVDRIFAMMDKVRCFRCLILFIFYLISTLPFYLKRTLKVSDELKIHGMAYLWAVSGIWYGICLGCGGASG